MDRGFFINHLINSECYPDTDCDSEVSQLWINGINGEGCYVPCVDDLSLTTWCHIVYELRIDPPLEFDDDYHVYLGFREQLKIKNEIKS